MSEETTQSAPATKQLPPAVALRTEIAARLIDTAPAVREMVVSELTKQDLEKRKNAVLVVLAKWDEKDKELKKKEKAGAPSLNAVGESIGPMTYSKDEVEAMKKLRDELGKISKALSLFFEENDTQKLYELSK